MELGPKEFIIEVDIENFSVCAKAKEGDNTKSFQFLNLILAQGSINITRKQLSIIFNQQINKKK